MNILKTIFSSPNEMKFLRLNLEESAEYIDFFIICEFNRTHVGEKREFCFEQSGGISYFPKDLQSKIQYFAIDVSEMVGKESSSSGQHENEKLFRGYFTKLIPLEPWDVVISVDADEIVFRQFYPEILKKMIRHFWSVPKSILLPIQQFFYKINYEWQDYLIDFGPVICHAAYYNKEFPSQWRGKGRKLNKSVGSHFSWCMPVDDMVKKLESYAHQADYAHLADKNVLEEAIRLKLYPFEPERDFRIKVLDLINDAPKFPQSLFNNLESFKELIGE